MPDTKPVREGIRRRRTLHVRENTGSLTGSVSLTMLRNEQDIVEPFLRHHAALLDLIVVLNHRSADRTREIALDMARELGNIVVADIPDEGYDQSAIMTRTLHHVQSTVFADFVFFLDADEFLPFADRQDMAARLASLPQGSVGLLPWRTFIPDPARDEAAFPDPLDRLTHARKREAPQYYKAVYRAGGNHDQMITVVQGNHLLLDAYGDALPKQVLADVPLLHFPVRSSEQMAAKGVVGWLSNQARAGMNTNDAYQWKLLHDQAAGGGRATGEALAQEALAYAQTLPVGDFAQAAEPALHRIATTRRYSDGAFAEADRLIAAAKAGGGLPEVFALPAPPRAERKADAGIANAFTGAWHWDHMFLDVPPVRFAVERLQPASVLDLGCGNGLYPLLYRHLGVGDVLGADGIEVGATVLDDARYLKTDLQQPFDAGRRFDLVVCLEVVEHLFPETSETVFDTITRHAGKAILFSMAEPGQPGNGHINCRPISDVLRMMAERGWHADLALTLGLRSLSSMSWFRRNIVLLRPDGNAGGKHAAEVLGRIGALPYAWYSQAAGKRDYPFVEPLPRPKHGYGLRIKSAEQG